MKPAPRRRVRVPLLDGCTSLDISLSSRRSQPENSRLKKCFFRPESHSFPTSRENRKWSLSPKPLTLQPSLSTKATMEFLKRVAAVRGRLVTSVMLS
ncbi:hypothetical protein EYF80_050503 [Liparis tanakae]|uniref:Uncharacterized protein n=1 Tax=Liparis tanakae TaxID=230148 RepID=A0A4Z2FEY8_9TELE|nr:hypothetical protein EYF80_050503 [Liparis tanakae]